MKKYMNAYLIKSNRLKIKKRGETQKMWKRIGYIDLAIYRDF